MGHVEMFDILLGTNIIICFWKPYSNVHVRVVRIRKEYLINRITNVK